MNKKILGGVAHPLPADLRSALARNEWICWAISVKTSEKRSEHVERVISELKEGMRRPCCWIGCTHRKDKALSPSQKFAPRTRSKK